MFCIENGWMIATLGVFVFHFSLRLPVCVFKHSLCPYLKHTRHFCACMLLLFMMHRIETSKRATIPHTYTQSQLHCILINGMLYYVEPTLCVLSNRLNFLPKKNCRIPFEYGCECMKIWLCAEWNGMNRKNESGINAFHASNIHSIERTWRIFFFHFVVFFQFFYLSVCLSACLCLSLCCVHSQSANAYLSIDFEQKWIEIEEKTNPCVSFFENVKMK